jgi:anaerobic magnesium-protoporphyrin IX monomethyl ester cyclase
MQHRIDKLVRDAGHDGPRVGIISTWDVENNAVRIIAAGLREAGHHATEIYFKDWISNHLDPATEVQLANLVKVIRRENLNLVCISIRASAYANSAKILTEYIREQLGIAVLWGGMHPTIAPDECIEHADMLLCGEGELALADMADRLKAGEDIMDTPNCWFRISGEEVVKNALRPLVQDLDDLPFRDFHTHDHKFFINGKGYTQGGSHPRGARVYDDGKSRLHLQVQLLLQLDL